MYNTSLEELRVVEWYNALQLVIKKEIVVDKSNVNNKVERSIKNIKGKSLYLSITFVANARRLSLYRESILDI